ncbi:MAG: hypothetical protein EA374_06245 [Acholeplasmatales bacterium]|nr:MAG: hypothetical protein EA374_06245 [Acholeplasmatales bacterium]
MKKLMLTLSLIILLGTLMACQGFSPPDDDHDLPGNGSTDPNSLLVLSSNLESATVTSSPDPVKTLSTDVSILASPVAGYRFDHWQDVQTGRPVSNQPQHTFTLDRQRHLKAIYFDDDTFGVTLYSNLDHARLRQSGSGVYPAQSSVHIESDASGDYVFLYWLDYFSREIVSTAEQWSLDITESWQLIAVYGLFAAPTLFYETGFDNTTKTQYAPQTIDVDGRSWLFDDALTGNLANDKRNGSRSVRMQHEGSITSAFKVPHLYSVSFAYASYGTDPVASVILEVSADGSTWETLATRQTTSTLTSVTIEVDATHSHENGVYIRIRKSGGTRVNIDDLIIENRPLTIPPLPEDTVEEGGRFPNTSTRLTLELEGIQHYFSYQDDWSAAPCQAIDQTTSAVIECSVYGSVDTGQLGYHHVTYYAQDEDGFYASHTVEKIVFRDASLLDWVYDDYYSGIDGLYGEALLLALRTIVRSGMTLQSYGDAREILAEADADPDNPDHVLLIYNRASVTALWDGNTWHREHVWPNSRLGVPRATNTTRSIATDLHNLRAINPSVNSSRSNKFFDYEETTLTYYPGEDRGDVARIYFYMITAWDDLVLRDTFAPEATTYTVEGAIQGVLSTLLFFHYDDPVDAFEHQRNAVIYAYQNNRNPFIDYPHLIDLLFYDHPALPTPE